MNRYAPLVLALLLGAAIATPPAAPAAVIASTQTYFQQGLEAYRAGQMQQALEYWQQALELAETPQQQAQILGNLAIAYYSTGQYTRAMTANQQALATMQTLGNPAAVGQIQSNLGNVYEALGDYESAIAAYQRSLEIAQATGDRRAEGISVGNLGYVYAVQGDLTAAIESYRQGLALARATGDREGESHRLLNLGIAYHSQGNMDRATQLYQQSLEVARTIGYRPLEAQALGSLGLTAAASGDYPTAIANLQASLTITQDLQDPSLVATTLNNLGHALLGAGRLSAAEAYLRQAIANLDNLRSDLPDAYQVSVFDTQIYTYNLLSQVLVAQNRPEAALEIAEAGRARAFAQQVAPQAGVAAATAPSLEDIRAIARDQQLTLVEYTLVPEDAFHAQGKQRGRTGELYIWVVQPTGEIHFQRRPLSPDQPALSELVAASRRQLGVAQGRGASIQVEADLSSDHLRDLYQQLIAPIAQWLPTDPNAPVVLIPQEILYLVPFAALQSPTGSYLIEHHTLSTAPSIQVLGLASQVVRQRQQLDSHGADNLIVGDPVMPEVWTPTEQGNLATTQLTDLPGAKAEAETIGSFLNTPVLTGAEATETRIKQILPTVRLIHLATHGLLEYGQPQTSGIRDTPGAIALAPSPTDDGLLTAHEIQTLQLQADLAVLSACDTGLGEITGDGVVGLARSLIGAGVPSVVVSLWSVPDTPTAELMMAFYRQRQTQPQAKAQALRQAMLETMAAHPDPRDWAGFVLMGAVY